MFLTHGIFTILTITQGLVWVDFIRSSVSFIMPKGSIPPLLSFITAMTTTAIAVFVLGVIMIFTNIVQKRREQETPCVKNPTGLYAIPTTILRAIPRAAHSYT